MAENIRWTEEEKHLVAAEAARLRRVQLQPALVTLLNEAQKNVLPPERQRPALAIQSVVDWFPKAVREEIDKNTPVIEREVEKVIEIPQSNKAIPTPELLAEVVLRLASNLGQLDKIVSSYSATPVMLPAPPAVTTPSAPTLGEAITEKVKEITKKKPLVVVAGVIQNQPRYFEQKLGSHCEFVFVRSDQKKISELPKTCDACYAFTKFLDHGIQQQLRSRYNGKVRLHSAGISTLVDLIATDLHITL